MIINDSIIKFFKDWKELLNSTNPDLFTLCLAMANTKGLLNKDCITITSIIEQKGYPIKEAQAITLLEKLKKATDDFIELTHITGSNIDKVNWLEFCQTYLHNYCGLTYSETIDLVNSNSAYLKASISDQNIIIDIS